MNRLRDTRCYLSGAMDLAEDRGVGWRLEIGDVLRGMGITVLDPTNKPIEIREDPAEWERLRKAKKFDELSQLIRLIRCVDLRMVDISDFLVVNMDLSVPTCGTWEELFLANRQKKPIIVRMKQSKSKTPGWLFGTIPHQMIFSTWDEVTNYLRAVDRGDSEHYKRWFFFDFNKTFHGL